MRVTAVKRFRAWLLLATFVASLGSSSLNFDHLGIIDTACGDVSLAAGSGGARLANPDAGAEHCPVCHFLRAVSGASAAVPARLAGQHGLAIEFASVTKIAPAVDPLTVSSRGPPARSLTFVI